MDQNVKKIKLALAKKPKKETNSKEESISKEKIPEEGTILAKANKKIAIYFPPPAKAGGNAMTCHRLQPVE